MSGLKEIKNRITSVKNTRQITKAMNMVAAAKLRRAHTDLDNSRRYSAELANIVGQLGTGAGDGMIPLMEKRSGKGNAAVLLITSDKGLCGGLNNNLNKKVLAFCNQHKDAFDEIHFYCFGKKGRDYFERRQFDIKYQLVDIKDSKKNASMNTLMVDLIAHYHQKKISALYVAFTEFKSVISHHARIKKILPFETNEENPDSTDFLFEPSTLEVMNELLPKYITNVTYISLLESIACEHGARMTAMDSATRNAGDMISKLSLKYNRARQAAITTELTEIISGAESVQ